MPKTPVKNLTKDTLFNTLKNGIKSETKLSTMSLKAKKDAYAQSTRMLHTSQKKNQVSVTKLLNFPSVTQIQNKKIPKKASKLSDQEKAIKLEN